MPLFYYTFRIMDIKPRSNHKIYIQMLRRMRPEERLLKAFELSDFALRLFTHGLKNRFPSITEDELKKSSCRGSKNVTTGIIRKGCQDARTMRHPIYAVGPIRRLFYCLLKAA